MRHLSKAVVAGGVVYPAGTGETEELSALVTRSDAWSEGGAAAPVAPVDDVDDGLRDEVLRLKAQVAELEEQKADLQKALDAALADTAEVEDYSALNVADLEQRVTARNEGRQEDQQIVVGGKGNKPDLIAALQSDDARASKA